jgi:hypothetical protein
MHGREGFNETVERKSSRDSHPLKKTYAMSMSIPCKGKSPTCFAQVSLSLSCYHITQSLAKKATTMNRICRHSHTELLLFLSTALLMVAVPSINALPVSFLLPEYTIFKWTSTLPASL